jgi:hypothetical protein
MHRIVAIAALLAGLAPAQGPGAAAQDLGAAAPAPPAQAPTAAPEQTPGQTPEQTPAQAPTAAPKQTPGQTPAQEPAPVIELITMGTGELIWEKYGHTAMCVRYADPRLDRCYNYGTTDFSAPAKLVWDFLRNRTLFWVSSTTPQRMLRFYSESLDRSLWVQRLPFTPDQARETVALLERAVAGENKYYRYHHYDDNCTTRLRDIIDKVTGGALRRATESKPFPYTLREVTRRGMTETPLLALLSDFPLGRRADRRPDMWDAMHLPEVLMEQVAEHLDAPAQQIYQRQGRPFDVSHPPSRVWLFLVALAFALPALVTWGVGRFQRVGLALSILPAGLMAVLMWFMAIISTLPEIRWNETLLVLWPTDLALPFLSAANRVRYGRVRVAWLALMLGLSLAGVLAQPLWAVIAFPLLPCAVAVLSGLRERAAAAAPESGLTPAAGRGTRPSAGKRQRSRR